jgi:FtsH-binding integral membrane protein
MHTLRMTLIGFVVLAVFVMGAWALNRSQGKRIDGAWIFIWVWLVAAVVNLLVGVYAAGVPLTLELLVLAIVFGLPALAAWYLSRNFVMRHDVSGPRSRK